MTDLQAFPLFVRAFIPDYGNRLIDTLDKIRPMGFVTSRWPLEVDKADLLRVLHLFREEK
jgi:hypothetical protein